MNTQKWKKTCSYCKSFPINDDDWQKLVDNNLIKDEKITKKGLKYLQVQSIELKKKVLSKNPGRNVLSSMVV